MILVDPFAMVLVDHNSHFSFHPFPMIFRSDQKFYFAKDILKPVGVLLEFESKDMKMFGAPNNLGLDHVNLFAL